MPKLPAISADTKPAQPLVKTVTVLRKNQIAVLRILSTAVKPGWLTRTCIQNALQSRFRNPIASALGRSQAVRAKEEQRLGYSSLLTLGYVEERNLEIEVGIFERSYRITPSGRTVIAGYEQ